MTEEQLNTFLDKMIYENDQNIKECDQLDNYLTQI